MLVLLAPGKQVYRHRQNNQDQDRRQEHSADHDQSQRLGDGIVDMPLDSEWRMEVADEAGNPVFKFRILAETV